MKLSNLILKSIFIISIISILSTFLISIILQYNTFINEREYIKKELVEVKKDEIKREVLKIYNQIEYEQKKIEQNTKERLKQRVQQAHNIASAIYEENKNKKDSNEIKYLIVTALKNISFNEKRAYYFINSNNGKAILFNTKNLINSNKNLWNLKDNKGRFLIQEQSKIALNKDEGFLINYFVKPDLEDNKEYPKLSFVKNFKAFNWHIGMGEYLDDIEYQTREKILKDIASFRYGTDGYIFVNSLDKKALVFDGKKLSPPKAYPNEKLFKQQVNAIKNEDGDFLFYKFKKLNTQEEFPKIAYVKLFEKWNWIIGSGVYIDNIDNEIKRQEDIFKNAIIRQAGTSILIIALLSFIVFLISRKISKYIDNNVKYLIKQFKNASKEHKLIKTKELSFKEFSILGKSLNATLVSRNETELKLKSYINLVDQNIIISETDENGIITEANNAFCKISGYTKEELIGNSHKIVKHPDTPKKVFEEMWKDLKNGKSWRGELKNRKKNGYFYWVDIVIHPRFLDGKIIGYTALRQDITDKKKVEYLSITDELTQLYNRRHFNEKIEKELNRAKRENHFISFFMLDLDHFKDFNDTYGHQAGDEALKKVSKILKSHTKRASDFAFRIGGEEFAILACFSKEESIKFAKLIQEDIEKLKIEHKTSQTSSYITISIGLVVRKGLEVKDSKELYMLADKALYKAKEEGRNRVSIS